MPPPSCSAVLCPYSHLNSCVFCLTVKVLGCDGNGWVSDVASGLEWVLDNAQQPAVVYLAPSVSEPNTALDNAVLAVLEAGISVVVGAGSYNQGTPPDLWISSAAVSTLALLGFLIHLLHCPQLS